MSAKQNIVSYYPLAIDLVNRNALVVGAGKVAERKLKTLLKSKAKVTVVAPQVTPLFKCLFNTRRIRLLRRPVRQSDIKGKDIIIAATSDQQVNKKVSSWAKKYKVLVNVVDQPLLSDFISPAVFRAKKAIVAVYTDGKDPVLSRDLKNFLKEHWDVFLSYRDRL